MSLAFGGGGRGLMGLGAGTRGRRQLLSRILLLLRMAVCLCNASRFVLLFSSLPSLSTSAPSSLPPTSSTRQAPFSRKQSPTEWSSSPSTTRRPN